MQHQHLKLRISQLMLAEWAKASAEVTFADWAAAQRVKILKVFLDLQS